jgi:hypothetical protein
MIKRFIIRGVSKRFTGVKKVAPSKPDKPKAIIKQKKRQLFRYDPKKKSIFGIKPPFDPSHPGIKDLTLKAGRTTETATFLRKRKEVRTKVAQHIKIRKAKGEKLFKKTTVWSKPPTRLQPSPPKITVIKRTKFGKQVKKFTDQALTKEFGIAQKTGLIRAKKLGKKLNIGIGGVVKGPKIKPSKLKPGFFTSEESESMKGLTSMRFAKRKGLPSEPREGFDPFHSVSKILSKGKTQEIKGGTTFIERLTHPKTRKTSFFARKKFYTDPKWDIWKRKIKAGKSLKRHSKK